MDRNFFPPVCRVWEDHTSAKSVDRGNGKPFELDKLRPMIEAKNQAFTKSPCHGDRATIDRMFTDDARCFRRIPVP